ncbi:MAG: hypothetical protein JXA78_08270 [Anaerolineales bacterium]|nr:hypothetical protein [Anaerolineales bacterium]
MAEAEYSPSVFYARDQLVQRGAVYSADLVEILIKDHPEYGGYRAKALRLDRNRLEQQRPVDEWLQQARQIFDEQAAPQLNGRLVILALSRLDHHLGEQLEQEGFLAALEKEYTPPPATLLSEKGRLAWGLVQDVQETSSQAGKKPVEDVTQPGAKAFQVDRAYLHLDQPALEDELGREPFAEALALHLRYLRQQLVNAQASAQTPAQVYSQAEQDRSFLLQLYGPWGSGKSSLLNFLRKHLAKALEEGKNTGIETRPWIVAPFNAWRNQRVSQPWWAIMNAVYRSSLEQLWRLDRWRAIKLWAREHWWRFYTTSAPRMLALALLSLLALAVVVYDGMRALSQAAAEGESVVAALADYVGSLDTLLTSLAAVAGFAFSWSRSMLAGTASAAESFVERTPDPMQHIAEHFKDLVAWVDQPIAVFIDDLDRCEADYVVRLLEGVQTLFRAATVFYVVAADARWLRASYEKAYTLFVHQVEEPGHPLGTLFMEKIFQLSAPVPGLYGSLKDLYWQSLVMNAPLLEDDSIDREALRAQAQARLGQITSDQEIVQEVEKQRGSGMIEQIFRAEAMKRLVSPEVQSVREHRLQKYRHLVGESPRAMKRMVNFYAILQGLNTLSGNPVDGEDLPLWTILQMRWPHLGEYLSRRPAMVQYISPSAANLPAEIPPNLAPLFTDEAVYAVVTGEGLAGDLRDERKMRLCAGLVS